MLAGAIATFSGCELLSSRKRAREKALLARAKACRSWLEVDCLRGFAACALPAFVGLTEETESPVRALVGVGRNASRLGASFLQAEHATTHSQPLTIVHQ